MENNLLLICTTTQSTPVFGGKFHFFSCTSLSERISISCTTSQPDRQSFLPAQGNVDSAKRATFVSIYLSGSLFTGLFSKTLQRRERRKSDYPYYYFWVITFPYIFEWRKYREGVLMESVYVFWLVVGLCKFMVVRRMAKNGASKNNNESMYKYK